MNAVVRIVPSGLSINASKDKPLLFSLLACMPGTPYQCLEGHCGACEMTLLGGKVEYEPFYRSGMLALPDNRVLSCIAKPVTDSIVLEPVKPEMAPWQRA